MYVFPHSRFFLLILRRHHEWFSSILGKHDHLTLGVHQCATLTVTRSIFYFHHRGRVTPTPIAERLVEQSLSSLSNRLTFATTEILKPNLLHARQTLKQTSPPLRLGKHIYCIFNLPYSFNFINDICNQQYNIDFFFVFILTKKFLVLS